MFDMGEDLRKKEKFSYLFVLAFAMMIKVGLVACCSNFVVVVIDRER